jgi:hypothetical protein
MATSHTLPQRSIRQGLEPDAQGHALLTGCLLVRPTVPWRHPDVYTHAGGVFLGGLPPWSLGLIHDRIMYSQIMLDKPPVMVLNVLTLNKEVQMEKRIEIRIKAKANGKRVAFYRNENSKTWFHMTVADAVKALREGKAHVGIDKNVVVV